MISILRSVFKITIKLLALVFLLLACAHQRERAPISDRGAPPGEKVKVHIVAKGETLYSIAWRYNLDYKQLAKANGVDRSYNIYPGQRLNLAFDSSALKAAPQAKTREKSTAILSPVSPRKTQKPVTQPEAPSIRSKKTSLSEKKTPSNSAPLSSKSWRWPAPGKLIATFSSNGGLNKGIDIRGKLGEPVYAAAAGTVVYSGSGLRGYGKLIIVKHSEKYLSAYGHNRRLLVAEGDAIRAGDKIAEMGSSGTDSVKLHFEIRYDGTPVDPLKYLPRR